MPSLALTRRLDIYYLLALMGPGLAKNSMYGQVAAIHPYPSSGSEGSAPSLAMPATPPLSPAHKLLAQHPPTTPWPSWALG